LNVIWLPIDFLLELNGSPNKNRLQTKCEKT